MFDLPVHPLLVHLPAALLPLAFLAELLARLGKWRGLPDAAFWMLVFAAFGTPAAAASGWFWFRRTDYPPSPPMQWHAWLGTAIAVLVIVVTAYRWCFFKRATGASWPCLSLMGVVALAVLVQGRIGGYTGAQSWTSASLVN